MNNEKFISIELRSHKEYLELLKKLQPSTKYIDLVQIDDNQNDAVIVYALSNLKMIHKEKTNTWLGTQRGGAGVMKYTFEMNNTYWNYLSSFTSFFYNYKKDDGEDDIQTTEFGFSDIAFLDKEMQPLFFTTTHEGYAIIKQEL